MGYKPVGKLYHMQFADHEGLEVTAKGATLGELKHIQSLNIDINEKNEEKRMEVFQFFADRLVSWNMEHPEVAAKAALCPQCDLPEGADLPATLEGILCLELDMILAVIFGWVSAVARVALPKGQSLNDGGRNGLGSNLPDIPEEIMNQLEQLQNPVTSLTPN